MSANDILYDDFALIVALRREAEGMHPYCPYSGYPVRAAVVAKYGDELRFYGGANYEVVSFNQCMHAEHSAITAALNDRREVGVRIIQAVYVETRDGGYPCGHCRQIINEYAAVPNIPIFVHALGSNGTRRRLLWQLLPNAFDVDSLNV